MEDFTEIKKKIAVLVSEYNQTLSELKLLFSELFNNVKSSVEESLKKREMLTDKDTSVVSLILKLGEAGMEDEQKAFLRCYLFLVAALSRVKEIDKDYLYEIFDICESLLEI